MLHRRRLLVAAGALPLAAPALAQSPWPNKPVRVIVGFPPGGSLDVMTRLACEQMQNRLGQAFVVETRSGASGNIGTEAIARATPDGYTIGTVSMHNLLINPLLFRRLPYDPQKDFAWISAMWDLPNVAAVPAQHVPARTVAEFVTWAKARPQGVSFGSSGVGTTIHLSGAYLMAQAGIRAEHVTFRGAAQTIPAMLSGDLDFALDNLASYVPVIQEGRMRALAITSAERWPTLPDVPTMAEAGVPNFVVSSWQGFVFPAGTPRAAIDRLNGALRRIAGEQALKDRFLRVGAQAVWTTPEEMTARAERERPMWQEAVRVSGARVE